jgi:hypothetical protein
LLSREAEKEDETRLSAYPGESPSLIKGLRTTKLFPSFLEWGHHEWGKIQEHSSKCTTMNVKLKNNLTGFGLMTSTLVRQLLPGFKFM